MASSASRKSRNQREMEERLIDRYELEQDDPDPGDVEVAERAYDDWFWGLGDGHG